MRYRRAVKRAGIDDLTFHDLRHIATPSVASAFAQLSWGGPGRAGGIDRAEPRW
jgi:integrase